MDKTDNYQSEEDASLLIVAEPESDYKKVGTQKINDRLTKNELNFKYQLIKGRIAENIVQELFLSEGYQVYKFGIENNYPFLLQQIKGNDTKQSISLRIAPDLVILDPTNNEIFYVEVKFCSSSKYKLNRKIDLENYMHCYPNTFFFIVGCEYIYLIHIEEFVKAKEIDLTEDSNIERYEISKTASFSLRPMVIDQFKTIATNILQGVPKKI